MKTLQGLLVQGKGGQAVWELRRARLLAISFLTSFNTQVPEWSLPACHAHSSSDPQLSPGAAWLSFLMTI